MSSLLSGIISGFEHTYAWHAFLIARLCNERARSSRPCAAINQFRRWQRVGVNTIILHVYLLTFLICGKIHLVALHENHVRCQPRIRNTFQQELLEDFDLKPARFTWQMRNCSCWMKFESIARTLASIFITFRESCPVILWFVSFLSKMKWWESSLSHTNVRWPSRARITPMHAASSKMGCDLAQELGTIPHAL